VSNLMLDRFIEQCNRDRVHFYSPHLFYEHKLAEVLKGTRGTWSRGGWLAIAQTS
jgi:hypothetical protein